MHLFCKLAQASKTKFLFYHFSQTGVVCFQVDEKHTRHDEHLGKHFQYWRELSQHYQSQMLNPDSHQCIHTIFPKTMSN